MDAVFSVAQIHRARAERIGLATSHEPRQVRLARDHLLWREPVGPFFHAADALDARPGEAFAADAYAVTDRLSVTERQVEVSVRRVDDDGAWWLNGWVIDDRPAELRRYLFGWRLLGLIIGRQSRDRSAPWRDTRGASGSDLTPPGASPNIGCGG